MEESAHHTSWCFFEAWCAGHRDSDFKTTSQTRQTSWSNSLYLNAIRSRGIEESNLPNQFPTKNYTSRDPIHFLLPVLSTPDWVRAKTESTRLILLNKERNNLRLPNATISIHFFIWSQICIYLLFVDYFPWKHTSLPPYSNHKTIHECALWTGKVYPLLAQLTLST